REHVVHDRVEVLSEVDGCLVGRQPSGAQGGPDVEVVFGGRQVDVASLGVAVGVGVRQFGKDDAKFYAHGKSISSSSRACSGSGWRRPGVVAWLAVAAARDLADCTFTSVWS